MMLRLVKEMVGFMVVLSSLLMVLLVEESEVNLSDGVVRKLIYY